VRYLSLFALISAMIIASPAHAQFATFDVKADPLSNTVAGESALNSIVSSENSSGSCSASGFTCGEFNTAVGSTALLEDSSGSYNTGLGAYALELDNGSANTAIGNSALRNAAAGNNNTAVGSNALFGSTTDLPTGSSNTAMGANAIQNFTSASYNSALGQLLIALATITTGNYNTASGYEAMYDNTVGAQNSAYGVYALHGNGKGDYNAALGGYAMYSNTSGSSNIALGYKAGFYPTAGANNIHIGNLGAGDDTALIKIGTQGTQVATFIASITGVVPPGTLAAVYVNSNGQLGVGPPPAESVKADVSPMLLNELKQQAAEIRELRAEVQALQASQHN